MSYARWGNADVYVFEHCDGFFTCMSCSLAPDPDGGWPGDFETRLRSEMIAHLERHESEGQRTGTAIGRLRAEVESVGDELALVNEGNHTGER